MTVTDHALEIDLSGVSPLHPTLPHSVLFTKPGCTNCKVLARRAHSKGLPLVKVDITEHPAAYDFLTEQNVLATPTTIIYNVYPTPMMFSGALPDQLNYLIAATKERLLHLENADHLLSADDYLTGLSSITTDYENAQVIDPAAFAAFAGDLVEPQRLQVKTTFVNRLASTQAHNPEVLMTVN